MSDARAGEEPGGWRELARLTAEELVHAAGIEELVGELAEPVEYFLGTTGKQLRSTVVLRAAGVGPRPADPLVRLGAVAVELSHLATLAHDDVIDGGRIRRGARTVDVMYGSFASGFVGGVLFARAGELAARCGAEPMLRFARAGANVCKGQMAEFEDLFDLARSVRRYRLAIAGKTASLFELAAWLGAWLAGAAERTTEALARFGRELGMAFQIADDVLDLTAPESETGKVQAKDLREGVYSLPVIHALRADARLREQLEHGPREAELPELLARIERSGAIELAISQCKLCARRARMFLNEDFGVAAAAAEELAALLDRALAPIDRLAARSAVEVV
jgi:heptaprenyl diphosphate synthase